MVTPPAITAKRSLDEHFCMVAWLTKRSEVHSDLQALQAINEYGDLDLPVLEQFTWGRFHYSIGPVTVLWVKVQAGSCAARL